MSDYATSVPGYPRVGTGRPYKKLLEGYWNGTVDPESFAEGIATLRAERLRTQAAAGLDHIPVGDFSLYDHVLDTAVLLGCIPPRFGWNGGAVGLDLYFALARGRDGVPPLEMTKWFDTNYHYLVPELPQRFTLTSNRVLQSYRFARAIVGERAQPVLLGPFTFLKLARLSGAALAERLTELTPIYSRILRELAAAGATHAQLDEPALAGDVTPEEWAAFAECYTELAQQGRGLGILIGTYYGDVAHIYSQLCSLPVAGIGLDFVRGRDKNLAAFREHGFPAGKILVAGVVDGRNIWRTNLDLSLALLRELVREVGPANLRLSASCSLLHLPETVASETGLTAALRGGLCFAQERLGELDLLARALRYGVDEVSDEWFAAAEARRRLHHAGERLRPDVQDRVAALCEADFTRIPYEERAKLQAGVLDLPPLPTTTIGSFPQTQELRRARAASGKDRAAYETAVADEIGRVIRLQEELGLDVLVHGEPERNDMVQFFAEKLDGFAFTHEGWVQSYGSRCVRPPLLYGDVARDEPLTLYEARLAQSLTSKPVKGMLTGPITMLQWSFVRDDISREEVAYQIALAIRDEARDLAEEAGLRLIQVDEAAFREALPLHRSDWAEYLNWAVRAFRLATSGVPPQTQIHTHMCYSEFGDIIGAIAALDADVISIEDARSDGAVLTALRDFSYPQGIGPGVYDIHSPNVPTVAFIAHKLQATLDRLPAGQVWVNPDCGLKTRGYAEVLPSLRNMVEAARQVREEIGAGV